MKLILLFTLCAAFVLPSRQSEKHPFEHLGSYEASNESTKEYFYSGEVHASWMKAAELCEIFGMKLLTFDDGKEEENFREKFAAFFDGRDAFIFIGANTTQAGSRTEWKWLSGAKIDFDIKWGEKQPNAANLGESCLSFDEANPLLYHDMGCELVYPFVCKESWVVKPMKVKE